MRGLANQVNLDPLRQPGPDVFRRASRGGDRVAFNCAVLQNSFAASRRVAFSWLLHAIPSNPRLLVSIQRKFMFPAIGIPPFQAKFVHGSIHLHTLAMTPRMLAD